MPINTPLPNDIIGLIGEYASIKLQPECYKKKITTALKSIKPLYKCEYCDKESTRKMPMVIRYTPKIRVIVIDWGNPKVIVEPAKEKYATEAYAYAQKLRKCSKKKMRDIGKRLMLETDVNKMYDIINNQNFYPIEFKPRTHNYYKNHYKMVRKIEGKPIFTASHHQIKFPNVSHTVVNKGYGYLKQMCNICLEQKTKEIIKEKYVRV